jgi:hypothetical protein
MINEIARRTTGMAETTEPPSSPPKVAQDTTAAMMTQLLGMLAPIASRLEALEQRPAYPQDNQAPMSESSSSGPTGFQKPYNTTQPKFPHPELFDGDRSKYAAFRYKSKAKLRNEYERLSDEAKIAYVVSCCTERASDVILPWAEQNQAYCLIGDL